MATSSSIHKENPTAWKQILLTAIITAIFTFIVSLVIIYLTKDQPNLLYEQYPPSLFVSDNNEVAIINTKVENTGSEEAEDVVAVFTLPENAKFLGLSIELSSRAINYVDSLNNDSTTAMYTFPLLNPEEYSNFSFLVTGLDGRPIDVDVRAKGVTGRPSGSEAAKRFDDELRVDFLLMALLLVTLLVMLFVMLTVLMVRLLSRYILTSPERSTEYISLGVDYCDMGLIDEAVAVLRRVIYQDPGNSVAHSNLARAYAHQDEFGKAFSELKIGKTLAQNDGEKMINYYIKAQLFSLKKEADNALASLEEGCISSELEAAVNRL